MRYNSFQIRLTRQIQISRRTNCERKVITCTTTINNYDEIEETRLCYLKWLLWMTLKLLFEEKHCARKNGSAKVYFFVVKLRIKFKVLSLNITHFFNCERIYNKYIILTVTWSEESDHVLIQPFGSSYCYNNIILTISRFEKLHVQTNR